MPCSRVSAWIAAREAFAEHRHEAADPVHDAEHVDGEDPLPVLGGRRPAGAENAHPGVVAQQVRRAERLARQTGEGVELLGS
jgi:hypothetical protein